jgi:[ribosomal protein S18]-alanine N-acetyltransferase
MITTSLRVGSSKISFGTNHRILVYSFVAYMPENFRTIKLLPAQEQHLSAIAALDKLSLDGMWTISSYQRELASPNSVLQILINPGDQYNLGTPLQPLILPADLVTPTTLETQDSTCDESVLGIGCFWQVLEEAHITRLAVYPGCWGQGLGQMLLHQLLQVAHERGLERATLEVRESNQVALNLYEKFDFQLVGRRRRYYEDTGEDGLILWRGGLSQPDFQMTLDQWQQSIQTRLHQSGWKRSAE